jgi:hypothetical protein
VRARVAPRRSTSRMRSCSRRPPPRGRLRPSPVTTRRAARLADAFSASVQMADRATLVGRQLLLARAHLLRGSAPEAEAAARRALALAEPSDAVPKHANALLMLAEVLDARDQRDDAAVARSQAIAKLRAKGNLAAVARLSS